MTPNIDRNEAPETWITAAPMDTLTVRGPGGVVVPNPPITMIPVQFHLYWAGSDKDGSIAGFYVAVVETTATAGEGGVPPLPGPKPTDYHFTTRTDSTFIFTVDGDNLITDRLHALYIYAVDDKGKADPTPARMVFDAHDEHPPTPVIDLAYAEGDTVVLDAYGEPTQSSGTWPITKPMKIGEVPKEQVPAYSRLNFFWHGEVAIPNTFIMGYKYKLDEPAFIPADSSVREAHFGDPALGQPFLSPGQKLFTLRAFDQARGAGEANRNFMMNFAPDTWWAGPDPAVWPQDPVTGEHYVQVLHWPSSTERWLTLAGGQTIPSGQFGGTYAFNMTGTEPDSLDFRPSKRYPADYLEKGRDLTQCQRTFYEIYTDRNRVGRIYARSEGDTVHMNSWIVLWNGGYDKDSKYLPRMDWTDPDLNPVGRPRLTGAVLDSADRTGSPIGFRAIVIVRLTPTGARSGPAQSAMYPVWQPASVFRSPVLGGYWCMTRAGTAYALARAEDADGGIDNQVSDPVITAEDLGASRNDRRKVIVFYVDKPPVLLRDDPQFQPQPAHLPFTATDTTRILFPSPPSCAMTVKLLGDDRDPYDTSDINKIPQKGEASTNAVIRFEITLYGTSLAGNDTSWTYLKADGLPYLNGTLYSLTFRPGGDAPGSTNPFASGPMDISIQVCDCPNCEDLPGSGRCVEGINPTVTDDNLPWPHHPVPEPRNVIHIYYQRGVGCP